MNWLAWIPFLEPINWFHRWWYLLLIPLSFGISVAYKAIRVHSLKGYWWQVGLMTTQIVLGVLGLGILVALFVQFGIPALSN
ncbi:MAG: hypothetical protein MK089_06340 [Phycisphaerales bacterium]|nr:hypothetical protein [Phycisphaerae bacterium]MCH2152944.1 hypothetical protein [Phycisphaerales bacterium]|tara:strand:- start:666 stop:911 length:246 start_codon:yes stop_codon:yes gene_type:complete